MATQHFRSAINGFNRQDVVNYIEFLNNQFDSKVEQLNSQLQAASSPNAELQSRLDAALAQIAELEAQLERQAAAAPVVAAPAPVVPAEPAPVVAAPAPVVPAEPVAPVIPVAAPVAAAPVVPAAPTTDELEAYRRAERTERMARERAQQIHDQANAVLADATVKAEAASEQIGTIADQIAGQLQQYQDSIVSTKEAFQDAVASLYALRPEE